jgi:DNA-binding transcriptional LysR family regulator
MGEEGGHGVRASFLSSLIGSMMIGEVSAMNVHHLELFYYVAKYEGITSAVRHMPYGIQQPAVSGQILQLEEDLGLKLFQRRPFALTPAGQELYDFAAPFFSRLDEMGGRLRGEEGRRLRLAASAAVLTNHVPGILGRLREKVPDLKVTLREVMPAHVDGVLAKQEVDVAISILHGKPTPPAKAIELAKLPVFLVARREKGKKAKTFADLQRSALPTTGGLSQIDEPLITLPGTEYLQKLFYDELVRRGLRWEATMELGALEMVYSYALHGFGYGLGVDMAMPLPKGLYRIDLPKFPPLRIGLLHTGTKLQPVAAQFAEEAVRYAKALTSVPLDPDAASPRRKK